MQQEFITVTFNRTKIAIRCADILYAIMSDDHCTIHIFDGSVYRCRMTLKELKKQLNEEFIQFSAENLVRHSRAGMNAA